MNPAAIISNARMYCLRETEHKAERLYLAACRDHSAIKAARKSWQWHKARLAAAEGAV